MCHGLEQGCLQLIFYRVGAGTWYWLREAHAQPYTEKVKPVVIEVPVTGHHVAALRVEVAENDQVIHLPVEIFFHMSSESRIGA